MKEPPWTPDEITLLRELFPSKTYEQIARRLKRSVAGVKLKAKRVGLLRRKRTSHTPSQLGKAMRTCSKRVKEWIRKGWLKARLAPTRETEIHLVEVAHLVEFLEKHPDLSDSAMLPGSACPAGDHQETRGCGAAGPATVAEGKARRRFASWP